MDWVEVRDLWKRYGSTVALRGVSARFEAGTASVVMGPNGAGKSTLLSLLGTVARPTRGRVSYGAQGAEVGEVRGAVGWVGHESLCYPALSVRENVELAARLHGVDASAAWARAARRFDLMTLEGRACGTLSRGQLQRTAVARGLVHEPGLLLLDEPWTGLDAGAASRLDTVVREERDRGAIVVVVSHDAGVAERVGGRLVRLERGVLVHRDG